MRMPADKQANAPVFDIDPGFRQNGRRHGTSSVDDS